MKQDLNLKQIYDFLKHEEHFDYGPHYKSHQDNQSLARTFIYIIDFFSEQTTKKNINSLKTIREVLNEFCVFDSNTTPNGTEYHVSFANMPSEEKEFSITLKNNIETEKNNSKISLENI